MAQALIWSHEALDDIDRRVLAVIHGKRLLESVERFNP
jgi:hypothetical protein